MSELDFLVPKFLVFQNILTMVKDRGFFIPPDLAVFMDYNEEEHLQFFLEHLRTKNAIDQNTGVVLTNALSQYFERNPGHGYELGVYFTGPLQNKEKEVTKKKINEITTLFTMRPEIKQHIIVNPAKLSSDARNQLSTYEEIFHVTNYMEDELLHNPTTHFLTPIHEKIHFANDAEKKEFFRTLNITSENSLSRMEEKCPIAKWYGFSPGDIIRAVRDCGGLGLTCPKIPSYRFIANN